MGIVIKQSKKRFIQCQGAIFSILIILSILAAGSLPANAYTIDDYWLCKDVDESNYPYKPIDATNIFYDNDERVCFLFILEHVTTSHDLIVKYYHEEKLFNTTYNQIPDPRTEGYDYYTDFSFNQYLLVKGYDAADMPGQWRIEVYIDGKKEFMENFEIRSTTTTTTPTTTTSSPTPTPTPSSTVPQEEMSTTPNITPTPHQVEEKIEQSNFLSNPMYLILIMLTAIVVMIFIVLAKRKKPITPKQMKTSNKYCMNCGKLLAAEETFCGSCGEKVE